MRPLKETVGEMWMGYLRKIVPADALQVQVIETRRAFYAGAWAMFTATVDNCATLPEEEAEVYLQELESEIGAFKRDVEEGRA